MENEEIEPEEVDKDLRPMIDDYVDRSEEAFDEFGDVDGLYPAALIEQMDSLETQMPASAALQVLLPNRDPLDLSALLCAVYKASATILLLFRLKRKFSRQGQWRVQTHGELPHM